jgi:hypothetical protein
MAMEGMDLSGLQEYFTMAKNLIGIFRTAKDLIPEGKQKEVEGLIERAEQQSVAAEAGLAKALGYRIHQCEWPPQIMLLDGYFESGAKRFKCPACGETEPKPRPQPARKVVSYGWERRGL